MHLVPCHMLQWPVFILWISSLQYLLHCTATCTCWSCFYTCVLRTWEPLHVILYQIVSWCISPSLVSHGVICGCNRYHQIFNYSLHILHNPSVLLNTTIFSGQDVFVIYYFAQLNWGSVHKTPGSIACNCICLVSLLVSTTDWEI